MPIAALAEIEAEFIARAHHQPDGLVRRGLPDGRGWRWQLRWGRRGSAVRCVLCDAVRADADGGQPMRWWKGRSG